MQSSAGPSVSILGNVGAIPGGQAIIQDLPFSAKSAVPNPAASPSQVPQVLAYAPPMPMYSPALMPYFGQMYPNQYGVPGFFPAQPQAPASLFGMPGAAPSMPWYPSFPAYPAPYEQAQLPINTSLYNPQPAYPSATSAAAIRQLEQEREIKKLEQQLDALRITKELKLEEQEFLKLQERISGLQVQKRCRRISIPMFSVCMRLRSSNNAMHRKRSQVSLIPRYRVRSQ